ncbi:hypothetical protein LTR48_003713 [Friedmanniomyces endolithicus]|uniref:Transglycosylase SLT domain-containing protein n=1 Tax=Rachicladosporium monterosium TaxID=1507873 RepID=A0ABR0L7I7_9PEZI|nr:hypothetical protein LTR29_006618 [Friedmanniomyces endolithicus]KAK1086288.1 hypothetical protein LTR48_003713 [Friedmanniomyces endolithicus]KAK5144690.1 hypothetical protein LTR32_003426 [Rachicladosporium monterosium]
MAVFGILLLSALAVCSGALPTSGPLPNYRGAVGHWDVHRPAGEEGLARPSVAHNRGSSTISYQCFDGARNGDPSTATARWLPFDQLWALNEPTILSKNGGDTYITHFIREAIERVSCDDEIDPALVLAIVMQESSGRASVPCKAQAHGGLSRCGLMRATHGSSFDANHPRASITRMIREGVEGDGLDQALDGDARYLTDVANRLRGWTGRGRGYSVCTQ